MLCGKTIKRLAKSLSGFLATAMAVETMFFASMNVNAATQGTLDFVTRCYDIALGRKPDEAGLQEWARMLTDGEACGVSVAYGFVYSQEFQDNNYDNATYTEKMYNMLLGRESDAEGKAYWVEKLDNGESKEDIFYGFSNSQEFFNLCESYGIFAGHYVPGIGMDRNSDINCFVNRFYEVCLGRKGDIAGQASWVEQLSNGSITGTALALGFIFSPEYIAKNTSNEEFVKTLYTTFLGREADEAGLEGWTEVLNNGTKSREEVFNGFCCSAEFDNLCNEYGIERGEGIEGSTYTPATPTPTVTPTPSVKPTVTPTPSTQPTPSVEPTSTPTSTPKPTVTPTATPTPEENLPIDINVYIVNSDAKAAIDEYVEAHPEFAKRYNVSVKTVQEITPEMVEENGDLFIAEANQLGGFTSGSFAEYAAAYSDLFEDYDALVSEAELAQYSIDMGTRSSDGEVVGISYRGDQGLMLYRRSIAKEIFGTDVPSEIEKIFGAGSGNLDSFLTAADTLNSKGYAATSSLQDIYQMLRFSEYVPRTTGDVFTYSTVYNYSIDTVKLMVDNGYTNNTDAYSTEWYNDMNGTGERPVFCYLAPAWQIEYVNGPSCGDTAGDWAVCQPPINFFQGGGWVVASERVIGTSKEEAVKELINYLIFDTSEDGYQYKIANGKLNETKTSVASRVVMRNSAKTLTITGDQNIYEVIANMENFSLPMPTSYDNTIISYWWQVCRNYTKGESTKEEAIENFQLFLEEIGIMVNK
ncbi:MAG: DUF4214 domain-containing protein [Clostridia bacterium]|nr:DUF4214 domain-containing protein [Clostridia bacterium]